MKLALSTLILLVLITACGPSPEQQAAYTATALTATAASWTATPTATNTATATPTFTPTPTSTPTETPTPTLTPTETATPTPTKDPNRYYASDGLFSIPIPEGWTKEDVGAKYLALSGPSQQFGQVIVFSSETSSTPLAFYTATVQDAVIEGNPGITQIKEEFLQTSSGLDYFHWIIEFETQGIAVHQALYVFEQGEWKLAIVYTRQGGEFPGLDAAVDQAIDSIELYTPHE